LCISDHRAPGKADFGLLGWRSPDRQTTRSPDLIFASVLVSVDQWLTRF
jgi:hypothetical protein